MCLTRAGTANRDQLLLIGGEGDGGEHGVGILARIEPGVLHDDRNVGFDHARVVLAARNDGVPQLIESQMHGASRRQVNKVRAYGLAIGEKDRDAHVRFLVGGVEHASRLVTGELGLGAGAPFRDVTLRDSPAETADWHGHYATSYGETNPLQK